MLIRDKIYNMETPSHVPDDASEIFESLEDRDQQRKRAIDIARERADAASDPEERAHMKSLADEMSDVRHELHEEFPEVFDD